jgi:hydrogenase nickel incorporation protein HypA/HybF
MHEFSLVRSLLDQVAQIVAEQGGRAAVEVRVEIGPLSGVEPLLIRDAFHQLANGPTLIIEEVPLIARCHTCNREFELKNFRFVCTHCGGRETRVVRGDAFRLMSVTVDLPDDATATCPPPAPPETVSP